MNPQAGPEIVLSLVCTFIAGIIIGCPIFAVLLRAGAKWGENMDIDFVSALKTSFLVYIVNFLISIPFSAISLAIQADKQQETIIRLLLIPICFLALVGIISTRLRLSFGKAAKVALIIYLTGFAIALFLGVVLFCVIYLMKN